MANDDPDRQRLEDMLKASEQRRPAGGSPGEGASTQGGDEPREERPDDSGGAGGNGERPARATGTAKTMVTAGLITGGLSIPGALFPIVGVILGIAAIVLGVLVSRRAADARAKIAIGLGAVGLVLSVALFAIGLATLEEDGDSGDDSEESDDEDSGGDSDSDEDSGGDSDGDEGGSSSLLPPYVVAVTYRGVAV
jgi:hypothetical protein